MEAFTVCPFIDGDVGAISFVAEVFSLAVEVVSSIVVAVISAFSVTAAMLSRRRMLLFMLLITNELKLMCSASDDDAGIGKGEWEDHGE